MASAFFSQRKLPLTGWLWPLLLLLISVMGWLGYEAWKNPAAFRSRFQRWRGSGMVEVQVTRVELRRVGDHGHLTVTGNFRQTSSGALRLEPPLVVLLAAGADGATHSVERFTGAFLADPRLPPATAENPATLVALHYWLPLTALNGRLSLLVDGDAVPLKNSPGFSVDSLPNGQTVELSFPDGKIPPGRTSS